MNFKPCPSVLAMVAFLQAAYDAIECFAGVAKVTWCLRQAGLRCTALDIDYWQWWSKQRKAKGKRTAKHNPMDFNEPAGFVLLCCIAGNMFCAAVGGAHD